MARQVITEVTDDLDGSAGAETINFAYEGTEYEIDLSRRNKDKLDKALSSYIERARRVSKAGRRGVVHRRVATGIDTKAVRAWARARGITVAPRGRIPGDVIDKYRAAGN